MTKKLLLISMMLISILGCSDEPKELSRVSIGKVITATVINTSWNESMKTQITTEKAVCTITGCPLVMIGNDAYIVTYDDKRRYIGWSSGTLYRIPY